MARMPSLVVQLPQPGQMVSVRSRPAIVRDVVTWPPQSTTGDSVAYAVEVEYIDGWEFPATDRVLWHAERGARVISSLAIPNLHTTAPDHPDLLHAFLNANRWENVNQLSATRAHDANDVRLISPWQSAVQIEDYQLYPVLKALLMSRVGLLLADDVGLGKTVEAGLILSELISRRRIRRVLIVCPAALQTQWRDEMREKFYLDFTIVDRDETFRLRKAQGIDTNPWMAFPRIITSMDYLRQGPVLQEFLGASDSLSSKQQATLPWHLLIVDEVHNLTPARFGDDSQRTEMLRRLTPLCEHRLFLSATPHNGFTVSFSGILELLDPVHFRQEAVMSEQSRRWLPMTMVRRLKSDLETTGGPQRFPRRSVEQISLRLAPPEVALHEALRAYRHALTALVSTASERRIAEFLVTVLTKRLLSSSYAFARTWWQHVETHTATEIEEGVLQSAITRAQEDIADDIERQQRDDDVARLAGSWLQRKARQVESERQAVSLALSTLGWTREHLFALEEQGWDATTPPHDAKWDALLDWIDSHLRSGEHWRNDERVVIFTEYKDTLDYLLWRAHLAGLSAPHVEHLFGGVDATRREMVKTAFTDDYSPVRVLIGTDAVSEGINLQASCRFVVHADIPWNPMRLEQRNGRVDRHGQARDVYCWHFTSDDEADLRFLTHVVRKIDQARTDLGSVGKVIDAAVLDHFTASQGTLSTAELDRRLSVAEQQRVDIRDMSARDHGDLERYAQVMRRLKATERALGLSPQGLARLLGEAMALEGGSLEETAPGSGVFRMTRQPPAWKALIAENLAIREGPQRGALPALVFDPTFFQEEINGRLVYRPRADTLLVRLGHPLMRRAVGALRRRMWESDDGKLNRWTVQAADFPPHLERVALVHVLIEATNRLREALHQEVLCLPFEARGELLIPLDDQVWQQILGRSAQPLEASELDRYVRPIRTLWDAHEGHIRRAVKDLYVQKRTELEQMAQLRLHEELELERGIFSDRLKELHGQRSEAALERLRREVERQRRELELQPRLFPEVQHDVEQTLREKDWELARHHLSQMETLIREEQDRTLQTILPRRFALADNAPTIQPLAVEYWVRR